jgi:hypothetical protein
MRETPGIKKPKDLHRVNGNNMDELLWWAHHLSVTPEKLLSIIARVGDSAEAVKKSIREQRSAANRSN